MATLLSKDHVKFSELNSDFSNKIFVSWLKLLKTYSPSVFFKAGLKLYVFESLKLKSKLKFEKSFEMLEIWTFMGVKMAVTHFVT